MPRLPTGLTSLFLVLFVSGCATSQQMPAPTTNLQCEPIPPYLTEPLAVPRSSSVHNRGLLELLADYESLRRRANADRAAVQQLRDQPGSAGER